MLRIRHETTRWLSLGCAGLMLVGCRPAEVASPRAPAVSPVPAKRTPVATIPQVPSVSGELDVISVHAVNVSVTATAVHVERRLVETLLDGELSGPVGASFREALRARRGFADGAVPIAFIADASAPLSTLKSLAQAAFEEGGRQVGFVARTESLGLGWIAADLRELEDDRAGLVITEREFFVSAPSMAGLRRVASTTPGMPYDFERLAKVATSRGHADEESERPLWVGAEGGVSVGTLVEALHHLRGRTCAIDPSQCGYRAIRLYTGPDAYAITPAVEDLRRDERQTPTETARRIPRIRQAKAEVKGALDKDIIRRIVRAHINEVRHCYNQGLVKDPDLSGKVTVVFTIGANGKISKSKVDSTTLADRAVASCVAKAVKRWKFPKPKGGGVVVVTYPFVLQPG